MRMLPIASGSSGNCIYIGTDNTHILLDAGVSRKRIEDGLKSINLTMKDISAIFITHEHSDHTKGLGVISRKDDIPIYGTKGTIDGIKNTSVLGDISNANLNEITIGNSININDVQVSNIRISHDANEPVAYSLSAVENGKIKKASVVTDLGVYNDSVIELLRGSNAMLVEANHDISMLQVGPYPFYLKQRILGNFGHLSNESSGKLINTVLHDNINKIYLGHLSKENNYDKLAFETVKLEIDLSDNNFVSKEFDIEVAKRDNISSVCEF